MKLKVRTPDRVVLGLTKRELLIINNCLNEACFGLILDNFLPAREPLKRMLQNTTDMCNASRAFGIKQKII